MHPVFAIEESLDSVFRSISSLCLLSVNAVERERALPFGALCFPFVCAVPVPCTHFSAQMIPESFISVTSAYHTRLQNLRKTMLRAECERAYWEKLSGSGWAGGLEGGLLCTLQVEP